MDRDEIMREITRASNTGFLIDRDTAKAIAQIWADPDHTDMIYAYANDKPFALEPLMRQIERCKHFLSMVEKLYPKAAETVTEEIKKDRLALTELQEHLEYYWGN